jgi:hypothetical protein
MDVVIGSLLINRFGHADRMRENAAIGNSAKVTFCMGLYSYRIGGYLQPTICRVAGKTCGERFVAGKNHRQSARFGIT